MNMAVLPLGKPTYKYPEHFKKLYPRPGPPFLQIPSVDKVANTSPSLSGRQAVDVQHLESSEALQSMC